MRGSKPNPGYAELERLSREAAARVRELEQALRALHPETISVSNWTPLRAALLDFLTTTARYHEANAEAAQQAGAGDDNAGRRNSVTG